ncbi:MAG: GTPase Era [Actinomycetota bacterium]|jgi:GTP-binding protein Era|nr:GTPase Era [Actinomycetota bacterium]
MQDINKKKRISEKDKEFKAGFVAIAGRTNVGKSTLINNILGQKILATSSKAQTTRKRVNCIYNDYNSQIVFVDIPGFLKPKTLLTEKLNNLILRTAGDADLLLMMFDISSGIGSGDFFVYEKIKSLNKPIIFVLNKIDKAGKEKIIQEKEKLNVFDLKKDVIEVSALRKKNIDILIERIKTFLPESAPYFPDDILTDIPVKEIAAEIIREKLISLLSEELPHTIAVEIDKFEEAEGKKNLTKISAIIYVSKKSHKSMIIGKSGHILKEAGTQSRLEIEELLGNKVFIELWVKVRENWTMNEKDLKEFGLIN